MWPARASAAAADRTPRPGRSRPPPGPSARRREMTARPRPAPPVSSREVNGFFAPPLQAISQDRTAMSTAWWPIASCVPERRPWRTCCAAQALSSASVTTPPARAARSRSSRARDRRSPPRRPARGRRTSAVSPVGGRGWRLGQSRRVGCPEWPRLRSAVASTCRKTEIRSSHTLDCEE